MNNLQLERSDKPLTAELVEFAFLSDLTKCVADWPASSGRGITVSNIGSKVAIEHPEIAQGSIVIDNQSLEVYKKVVGEIHPTSGLELTNIFLLYGYLQVKEPEGVDLAHLRRTLVDLRQFTKRCRVDMHEPDNQGILARVDGAMFDNAMGNEPVAGFMPEAQELLLLLEDESKGEEMYFNLATLVALARLAALNIEV